MANGKFKIALLCGGPSLERAISLNSARTVLDHLSSEKVEILPVYFDYKKKPYLISRAQLYSNTPADFDFKLSQTSKSLTPKQLINFLKKTDLAFPVIHGKFGEDGEIQKFLEKNKIPYIGSASAACRLASDKYRASEFIKQNGFYTLPSVLLLKNKSRQHRRAIADFFKKNKIKRAIIKPVTSGSSIAVYSVDKPEAALKASREIFSKNIDDRVILEPFCRGIEFTVIILENRRGEPVALLPTEIELSYKNHQIFDYRKKYLATRSVLYHCPPRFPDETIYKIQKQAEKIFKLFSLRDFARFDGWLLASGKIWFSDFNPISGMEQNSFLFMQSSRLGLSHRDFLKYIAKNACRRYKINFPANKETTTKTLRKKKINVLFGGQTAERQVSVMSGTNVWLKLKKSVKYDPNPYLLDTKNQVWNLPYALTLYHTVEEIADNCNIAKQHEARLKKLSTAVIKKLILEKKEISSPWFTPKKMTLRKFIKISPYIFIGLHGGAGENGEIQKTLEQAETPFNGSGSNASRLCMDKFATSQALKRLKKSGIYSAKKTVVELNVLKKIITLGKGLEKYWKELAAGLGTPTIIVKPIDDGCSSGIARLYNAKDLKTYISHALKQTATISQNQLTNQHGIIEMPACPMEKIMFEEFINTDKVEISGNKLKWKKNTNWVEITCGLIEKNAKLRAFNPSLTVATGNVLTLEEKFQSGTGINITPPPTPYVSAAIVRTVKNRVEKVAEALSLKGYARVDAFMNIKTGELIIIEANTLPGLTPSTVIYHQALADTPPLYPTEFLEKIVENNY